MDFCLDEVTISGVAKAAAGVDYPDLSLGLGKTSVSNPIMTSRLTADPYAMEYNGRIYVYGTNDSQQYEKTPDADNNYSKINTINVYSSADMVNWTDHGAIRVAGSNGAANGHQIPGHRQHVIRQLMEKKNSSCISLTMAVELEYWKQTVQPVHGETQLENR